MAQDIKITGDKINFKSRVNGIIIKDKKVLTVQINNNGFYFLPGGHIEMGEDTKTAVLREVKEEVGIETNILKLVSLVEIFFETKNGKKIHELSLYYLLEPVLDIDTKDFEVIEHDKEQDCVLDFKWIDLNDIESIDFRPDFLKEILRKQDFDFKHIIFK